ncbi:hypothetical protein B0H14DRAFT_2824839, partial [Mycena olivaceomarginata]
HADRLCELEVEDPPLEPRPAFPFTQKARGLDKGCARDLPQLKKLSVNAIRAYSIDSRLNHDLCMAMLSGAGIYVVCVYIKIIDVFSIHDNIPAFHVGHEVLTADATNAAPFLKAVARDIKAYFSVISISSTVLFGYADIDSTSSFCDAVSAYLPGDPSGAGKVGSINEEFAYYNVAAYFSEFGSENCSPGVRPWTEATSSAWPRSSPIAPASPPTPTLTTPSRSTPRRAPRSRRLARAPQRVPASPRAPRSPLTPNGNACACVASNLGYTFKVPANRDFTALVGTLTGQVCGLLPNVKGSCADIGANGTMGVYGIMAQCAPGASLVICLPLPSSFHPSRIY